MTAVVVVVDSFSSTRERGREALCTQARVVPRLLTYLLGLKKGEAKRKMDEREREIYIT